MTLNLEVEKPFEVDFDYEEVAKKVINAALDFENCPYETEVNLLLTDDMEICKINKEYRDIDRATDVLSFPMVEYNDAGDFDPIEDMDDCFNPETGELMLGDIIISVDKVYEQAESYGHSILREYAFLICHSMLHLMGYDHMVADEAKIMENKQNSILDLINITRDI